MEDKKYSLVDLAFKKIMDCYLCKDDTLQRYGISIMDNNREFKNFSDILKELQGKYKG